MLKNQNQKRIIMSNKLLCYFENKYSLSEEEKEALKNIPFEEHKKGTVLLKEGQYSSKCYFVLKGCIREYYLKHGEDITTNFYTEFQVAFDAEVFSKGKPSKHYLECLEDTTVTYGTPESEKRMNEQFPNIEKIGKSETEKILTDKNRRTNTFVIMSPEERYLDLLENRPDLIQRVPQYQLASFLGIKPESLSRIKKRIIKKTIIKSIKSIS